MERTMKLQKLKSHCKLLRLGIREDKAQSTFEALSLTRSGSPPEDRRPTPSDVHFEGRRKALDAFLHNRLRPEMRNRASKRSKSHDIDLFRW